MRTVMLAATGLLAASALAQPVTPVAPVPRFGPGSPVYTEPGTYADPDAQASHIQSRIQGSHAPGMRLGRAGPPGAVLPSGQVGPYCMTPLWRNGYHATSVNCPLYLPARPGAQEQCLAHDAAGRQRNITVTFLDWDPVHATGSVDCRISR